jgi:hypothetical protein
MLLVLGSLLYERAAVVVVPLILGHGTVAPLCVGSGKVTLNSPALKRPAIPAAFGHGDVVPSSHISCHSSLVGV